MKRVLAIVVALPAAWYSAVLAEEERTNGSSPIPATRPEMKVSLEALKDRQPRIPLPTAAEVPPGFHDARMRAKYLPKAWLGTRYGSGPAAESRLDQQLIDRCFWVVSRGNNCQYCLGHQELKLRASGFEDGAIAALDSDWSVLDSRQRAALGYARKLTLEPHLIGDADIAVLKQSFSDPEVIELIFHVARFNAMNRWAAALGLPQDSSTGEKVFRFNTPTTERFQSAPSVVIPTTRMIRPALPPLSQVKAAIEAARERQPRVALPSEADARVALAGSIAERSPVVWERAISQTAGGGPALVGALNTIMTDNHLPVRLKAELALITAIHNRAWYAVAHAAHRLSALGVSPEEMATLFNDDASSEASAVRKLAAKLTANPHLVTDANIAHVREQFNDQETAQIVHVIAMSNMFDRLTEAFGLPLEDGIFE
jgi:alkylhydroperoxidase family enzyme